MLKRLYRIFALAVLKLFIFQGMAIASSGSFMMNYTDGVVTVKGERVNLIAVLETLSREAGLEIFLLDLPNLLSFRMDIEAMPLEEALKTLLKGSNYAVISPSVNRTGRIWIYNRNRTSFFESNARGATAVLTAQTQQTKGGNTALRGPAGHQTTIDSVDQRTGKHSDVLQLAGQNTKNRMKMKSRSENFSKQEASGVADFVSDGNTNGTAAGGAILLADQLGSRMVSYPTQASPDLDEGGTNGYFSNPPQSAMQGKSYVEYLQWRIDSGASDRDFEMWAAIKGQQYVMHDRERLAAYQAMLAGQPH